MWPAILSGLQFLGALLGFISQKDGQNNADDVKQAKEDQQATDERARITADVQQGNLDEIRKDVSEN